MPPRARAQAGAARLGLRFRVTIAFAVGALALSTLFALLTYQLARGYLSRQRETSALRQSYANAYVVQQALATPSVDVPNLLGSLETSEGSHPVLYRNGQWFAASLEVGSEALPKRLRAEVLAGTPTRQRFEDGSSPLLAVGLPLPARDAAYFEVHPLEGLGLTLKTLRDTMAAGAVVTTLAGGALGLMASRRVLRPVAAVSSAASSVAEGDLGVRLQVVRDPDLAVVARSFNQMTDSLRERIERESRFAFVVSHELRSPLTTLAASLEVLEARRSELPGRSRAALDLLAEELRRFQRLVQDLLEISRLDASAGEAVWDDIRLGEFLHHALAPLGLTPTALGDDAGAVMVRADKRRLERVVHNLVENANSHGGGVVGVSVDATPERVRVAVEDAGPGVAADERERIFERFVRGRAAAARGSAEGTGLGLSLVAEHVWLHGGRVWVEDRVGGGARFVVELPRAQP